MGRKKRPRIRCIVLGCPKLVQRRQWCLRHYREFVLPRCRVKGRGRTALVHGLCEPHAKNGGRPIRKPPKRRATDVPRLLAWNRLYLRRDAVPIVEREAQRLELTPTALLAEVVEAWARAPFDVRPPESRVCLVPDCGRPALARATLCRTHRLREEGGQPLQPISTIAQQTNAQH